MNVIVWQSQDNRLFTVKVKWLCHLAPTNNCAWLEYFSTWLRLTPEECTQCLFFFPFFASYHKILEIQLEPAQFRAAFCFCFNGRWNWLDKLLHLTERPLFVCFWSRYCHKIWLSSGIMRNSMQAVKQPISVKVSNQRGKLALWDAVSLGHLTLERLVRQLELAQIRQ